MTGALAPASHGAPGGVGAGGAPAQAPVRVAREGAASHEDAARDASTPPAKSRNVAGYVKAWRAYLRAKAKFDARHAKCAPLLDRMQREHAAAAVKRARLTGGQVAEAERRLREGGKPA